MTALRAALFLMLACVASLGGAVIRAQDGGRIVIGSKNFTESWILAEIVAQLVEARTDIGVERRQNLGGTKICFDALRHGEIDAYVEYTGTAWAVLLQEPGPVPDPYTVFARVAQRCRSEFGLQWLGPFGLDNTYAIAVRAETAERLGLRTISDLAAHAGELRAGFSVEFFDREDGWPGLRAAYGLDFASVRNLEHGLAYEAIRSGELDVVDAYATDGKLLRYPLRLLDDDRRFFPPYDAAPLFRGDTLARHPELEPVVRELALRVPDATIQELNLRVERDAWTPARAARQFLLDSGLLQTGSAAPAGRAPTLRRDQRSFLQVLWLRRVETAKLALEHLKLTLLAVLLAALVAVPMGILATRRALFRKVALAAAGVVQTIPSLALLAFMIPLPGLGLGVTSAIAALFLYAILPILRNTYTGIVEVDRDLIEAARGLGFRDRDILWRVQLPLAARTILAGIRTSTVIGIGVATLAAFIGAGGLGQPIVSGLNLNDTNLILTGAIPAALLALLADLALARLERRLTSDRYRG
ncbi:MAG: ABC transporter permease subunit [Planctomycetes bacterium]|nr:ABC transporter permease subunit [Planctomycetota bacterium]